MRLTHLLLGLVLMAALAGCGGDTKSADEELDERIAEINRTAPSVGLGEAAPPALSSGWKTNFKKHSVPFSEIQSGGPPKDGIPAIDAPKFDTALGVEWLRDREPVIALTVDGETRGYPLQIMTWHEIVNDVIQGVPVTVTFCPLCNTAIVFDRRVDGAVLDFGTTGKLRDSDLVMYDRRTESWWQQFSGEAIVGDYTGTELEQLPARIVSWKGFRRTYPESRVLNRETGYQRAYGENPYTGYDDVESSPIFPVRNADDNRLRPKDRVVYVEIGGDAVAVPLRAAARAKRIRVRVGGREVVVRWRAGVASALDDDRIAEGRDVGAVTVTVDGKPVPFTEPFWFAVAAFRRDVRVIR